MAGDRQLYLSSRFGHAQVTKNPSVALALGHTLLHFKSGAVATFIPKNACSTLRYSFALGNGLIHGADQFDWIHKNNKTQNASLREALTSPFCFVIIRNPIERLASLFLDKVVTRDGFLDTFQKNHFRHESLAELTFAGFVEKLESHGTHFDQHVRPQTDFLLYEKYDQVVRFDRMAKFIKELSSEHGIVIKDTRKLSHHSITSLKKIDGDFSDAPVIELEKLRLESKAPAYSSMLTPQIRNRIRNLYKADWDMWSDICGVNQKKAPRVLSRTNPAEAEQPELPNEGDGQSSKVLETQA